MNTSKSFAYGIIAVIFALAVALAFTACDDGTGGGTTHTHAYSTTWSYNATQHWHECTAGDGAKTDIANHAGDPCNDCGYDSTATTVTFNSVTANGSSTATTTTLTLTFSAAIAGLTADDITLNGIAGVSKGTLSGTGPTYTLPISGFTAGGSLSVAAAKTGYNISGSPKSVAIYYYTSGSSGISGPTNWTAVAVSGGWRGIAYGNNRFVAVGNSGKVAYSADGATWAAVADSTFGTGSSATINAIAYGNNRFVAVGSSSRMAYSDDNGETWTRGTYNRSPSYPILSIAYGNNRFVAGYTNGEMVYSDDGITWTRVVVAANVFGNADRIMSIAYGNNRFVAVGYFDFNDIINEGRMGYSADGITWTTVRDSIFSSWFINGIAYGNGRFVAVGGGKIAYADW